MREIKFRCWDIHCKWMDYDYVVSFEKGEFGFIDYAGYFQQDENIIVMQYTGLKDKNGKEIYEGDIVKLSNGKISDIVYVYDGWWFDGYDNDITWENRKNDFRHTEVIGNIYENPEMLKSDE